ncbi:MAG: fibronectin type III domain-containing protein, partial [Deltaproteobacteria bacterium]|nr:fibronectin type III domain-containing protein [Deltaproteobacteria bacterium]
MVSLTSKGLSGNVRIENAIDERSKWRRFKVLMLAALGVCLMLAGYGCGGGGPEGISSQVVSGVAAAGSSLAGEAAIKDSLGAERKTVIGGNGSFALDVAGMTGPFILRAVGTSNGVSYTLHSFASGPGTANINPFSNLLVASAAGVNDPDQLYASPDQTTLRSIETNLPQTVVDLQTKLKPLLQNFAADTINPISDHFVADGNHLDGVFDGVTVSLVGGVLTITNTLTNVVIFTGPVTDLAAGFFNPDPSCLPAPGSVPDIPAGLSATAGANQVSLSWTAVGNATSYNIYWSKTAGVTRVNGTKITGATNPYIHTGLTAATKYYYVVTAVNGAGESAASAEASATTNSTPPPPALPAAPTGLTATGGTKQVTLSWSSVPTATSYNIYWATTSGVTPANGTKITGATSPAVQTGLADSTIYY